MKYIGWEFRTSKNNLKLLYLSHLLFDQPDKLRLVRRDVLPIIKGQLSSKLVQVTIHNNMR